MRTDTMRIMMNGDVSFENFADLRIAMDSVLSSPGFKAKIAEMRNAFSSPEFKMQMDSIRSAFSLPEFKIQTYPEMEKKMAEMQQRMTVEMRKHDSIQRWHQKEMQKMERQMRALQIKLQRELQ